MNRDNDNSDFREKMMQTKISKLKAEIKKGVSNLSILPSVRNDLAKVAADVKKK